MYTADEDVPGVDELYAVKESLIGVQKSIKINAPLPDEKARIAYGQFWSRDGKSLLYGVVMDDQYTAIRWYSVRFGRGMPEAPIELTKGLKDGPYTVSTLPFGGISPDGHDVLLYSPGGDLYRIDLNASDDTARQKVNRDFESVLSAYWVLGGSGIAYTAPGQAFLVPADGSASPDQFGGFDSTLFMLPSADGSQLSFYKQTTDDVYVAKVAPGERIKKVNGTNLGDGGWFELSSDGHYMLYSGSEQSAASSEVYLVDLLSASWPRTTLLERQTLDADALVGAWAPDSSYCVFYGSRNDLSTKDVYVYDTATHAVRGLPYSVVSRDGVRGFTRAGAFIIVNQLGANDPVELLTINPNGDRRRLHQNALGKPYQGVQVAPDGTGAIFCNGASNEDLYYVDLRDDFAQAVALPGEGSAYGCYDGYASDSKGFVYYRAASDGSRKLYFADTTHQIVGKPVQVTREGRALNWVWQPTR